MSIRLNLGCYNKKIHGFINVDIRPEVSPDIIDDVFTLATMQNNSIDLIYICHTLEHATRKNAQAALARYYEILKPGGQLYVAVPDIAAHCEHYIYHKQLDKLYSGFWGSQRHDYDFHLCGWDEKLLTEDLQKIGFNNITRYNWWETDWAYVDDYSSAYANGKIIPQSENNHRLMSLNIKGIK